MLVARFDGQIDPVAAALFHFQEQLVVQGDSHEPVRGIPCQVIVALDQSVTEPLRPFAVHGEIVVFKQDFPDLVGLDELIDLRHHVLDAPIPELVAHGPVRRTEEAFRRTPARRDYGGIAPVD